MMLRPALRTSHNALCLLASVMRTTHPGRPRSAISSTRSIQRAQRVALSSPANSTRRMASGSPISAALITGWNAGLPRARSIMVRSTSSTADGPSSTMWRAHSMARYSVGKVDHAERTVGRQGTQLQREPAHPCQGAFAAHEQVCYVDAAVVGVRAHALRMEYVDVVAADTAQHRWNPALDFFALAFPDCAQPVEQLTHRRRCRLHLRRGSEARLAAIGQKGIDGVDVVHHVAVGDRARAARIVAGHAAQRRLRGRADVDREPEAVRLQPCIELVEHDARLDRDRHRLLVHGDDAIQMLAVIDHQRRADGLTALRASGASRQHGHAQLTADAERRLDIVVTGRDQHADGFHLIDGRISGVPAARGRIEQDHARHGAAQAGGEIAVSAARVKQRGLRSRRVQGEPLQREARRGDFECFAGGRELAALGTMLFCRPDSREARPFQAR